MVLPDLLDVPRPDYESLKVISREQWGAMPPKEAGEDEKLKPPVTSVVLMHTATEPCLKKDDCIKVVQEMQKTHMEAGLSDIQYNYVIGGDGHTYEGRGWNLKPPENPKCPDDYDKCLEIMFVGSYEDEPLDVKLTTPAFDLIQVLKDKEVIAKEFKFTRLAKFKKKEEQKIDFTPTQTYSG